MPYVKPISGHGGTARIMRYLTKDGRALAADYLNLEHDSRLRLAGRTSRGTESRRGRSSTTSSHLTPATR